MNRRKRLKNKKRRLSTSKSNKTIDNTRYITDNKVFDRFNWENLLNQKGNGVEKPQVPCLCSHYIMKKEKIQKIQMVILVLGIIATIISIVLSFI